MSNILSIEGVFIYIDDIIIICITLPQFIDRLKAVLFRAKEKRVSLGLPKCHFKSKDHEIKILGSIFVNGTRQIDPSRLTGLVELPAPKTAKDIRSFVGSINYIRDWLPSVSEIISPINELTRGNPRRIEWTSDHERRFNKIKQLVQENMPLSLPPTDNRVLISCDASDIAIGGVILEEYDPCEHNGTPLIDRKVRPISFFSRILSNSQKNWSTMQKEL
ncbi:hypothetical protein P9112_002657 [Eukaryota sp. TZLM1-RC]